MKIRIDIANIEKITAALKAVNGSAVDHTYVVAYDVIRVADEAEASLIAVLGNKKNAVGARYGAESGSSVPAAYKYSRISTRVTLERTVSGWFLIGVSRGTLWQKGGSPRLYLTAAQDELATAIARCRYTVRPASISDADAIAAHEHQCGC